MRYLSLFSGIEAATVAWKPLGWDCVGVAEIEPFPCAVLAHHYPTVPNLGSVTEITEAQIAALGHIDLVVFGSPCQDLSVAGKRKGLKGERSDLFFTAMRIIGWAREHCGCRFALWENVPGAFSSNQGSDFAAVVEHMAGLALDVPPKGWGTEGCAIGEEGMVEWAVLDAQWFGVAQRRRRVFALADFGDWPNRPPILLEPEGLRGDSAPSREAGEGTAGGFARSVALRGREGGATAELGDEVQNCLRASSGGGDKPHVITMGYGQGGAQWPAEIAPTLNAHFGEKQGLEDQHINGGGIQEESTHTLDQAMGIAIAIQAGALRENPESGPNGAGVSTKGVAYTLEARAEVQATMTPDMQVRRLTPRECERLQGFPDDYTLIPVRGKPAADGPRYKALGNSMAVPVMNWIGRQVECALALEDLL